MSGGHASQPSRSHRSRSLRGSFQTYHIHEYSWHSHGFPGLSVYQMFSHFQTSLPARWSTGRFMAKQQGLTLPTSGSLGFAQGATLGAWGLPELPCGKAYVGMDQYLLILFSVGWTSIYQLFWCSPGVQGFDTLPCQFLGFPLLNPSFVLKERSCSSLKPLLGIRQASPSRTTRRPVSISTWTPACQMVSDGAHFTGLGQICRTSFWCFRLFPSITWVSRWYQPLAGSRHLVEWWHGRLPHQWGGNSPQCHPWITLAWTSGSCPNIEGGFLVSLCQFSRTFMINIWSTMRGWGALVPTIGDLDGNNRP